MRELRHWKVCRPVVLSVIRDKAEEGFQPLIGSFRLSVRSGVVCRRDVLFDSYNFAEFSREFGCETGVSVADDLAGESKVDKYVFNVQCCRAFCVDLLVTWYKDSRFGAIIVCDGENIFVSLRLG